MILIQGHMFYESWESPSTPAFSHGRCGCGVLFPQLPVDLKNQIYEAQDMYRQHVGYAGMTLEEFFIKLGVGSPGV